jgi:hypothetical protein
LLLPLFLLFDDSYVAAVRESSAPAAPRNREEKRDIAFCIQVARCYQNMGNGQCQKRSHAYRVKTTFSPTKCAVTCIYARARCTLATDELALTVNTRNKKAGGATKATTRRRELSENAGQAAGVSII